MMMAYCRYCSVKITSHRKLWIHLPSDRPAGRRHEMTLDHPAEPPLDHQWHKAAA